MEYREFLESKRIVHSSEGLNIPKEKLSPLLFPWQQDITEFGLSKGKAAIFADCGLGKTPMQLEYAKEVHQHTRQDVLVLAPLAVAQQTTREAEKFDIPVNLCRDLQDVKHGINITNYDRLDKFNPRYFGGVVLDESSILKNYMGKTKRAILNAFQGMSYKLACTATPSPNDNMELLNHSEFLDVMTSSEALAIWFINNTMAAGSYRLKHHAVNDFWEWVSSWAISISKPSDLGYPDDGFILPPLNLNEVIIPVDQRDLTGAKLFRDIDMNATAFHREKRLTTEARAQATAEMTRAHNDQILIWCDTNYEADELRRRIPEAVEVRGSDSIDRKEQAALDFVDGKTRVLISKPTIFGYGLNFQHCHRSVFCGMNYSFELFYQAVRRLWRFGQLNPVDIHLVLGETEKHILDTVKSKQALYEEMKSNMVTAMIANHQKNTQGVKYKMDYVRKEESGQNWTAICGDCVEEIRKIPDNSVHLPIFSPPFSNLYIYSDSYRDMGNVKNHEEFFINFEYLVPELYRITVPGRLCVVHCKNLQRFKGRDGAAGIYDFRGDVIRSMEKFGWQYHSEVCIWTDPVREMQRTKAHGLLYKQLRKDASYSRQGMAEYLAVFRKWPDDYQDPEPVTHTKEDFPLEIWQRYASPVWFDIQRTDVLNAAIAREDEDEKHLAPLQLGVIERVIELWTNPGDIVFSPYMGVGSEIYQAVKMGRRGIGIELKERYWTWSVRYLRQLEDTMNQISLFDEVS